MGSQCEDVHRSEMSAADVNGYEGTPVTVIPEHVTARSFSLNT